MPGTAQNSTAGKIVLWCHCLTHVTSSVVFSPCRRTSSRAFSPTNFLLMRWLKAMRSPVLRDGGEGTNSATAAKKSALNHGGGAGGSRQVAEGDALTSPGGGRDIGKRHDSLKDRLEHRKQSQNRASRHGRRGRQRRGAA
jgi:hypothetical protein